ncbi:FAD-binding oxidoreductase, partial [Chloroflexota bacterium]
GVVLQDFNLALAKEGLFFPPDPQSFLGCTLGGAVAENAGGPFCLKYGVTKQYVLGLEVALADGSVMKLGGLTAKNRTGYELVMLFTGSEGTLGIITRITLRLLPAPKANKTIIAVFNDLSVSGEAVSNIISSSILPSKIELVDKMLFKRFEELFPSGLAADTQVILLIQVDGLPETVQVEAMQILDICKKSDASEAMIARDQTEADRFWQARRAGFSDVSSAAHTVLSEDVVVPRSKIAEFVKVCQEKARQYDVSINLLGHAGDGNLHPSVLTDQRDSEHYQRALKWVDEIIDTALSLGGVLSGEHGVGLEKQRFFRKAIDPVALNIMKKIKDVLDPNHIINPGKIWKETSNEE